MRKIDKIKIVMHSGKFLNPFHLTVDDFDLFDIAHHLSMICRYNGATKKFYSVAEHCIDVSKHLAQLGYDANIQMAGLLHDADEAYLHDIRSPIKSIVPEFEAYSRLTSAAVMLWAGVSFTGDVMHIIGQIDRRIRVNEMNELLPIVPEWKDDTMPLPLFSHFICMAPDAARDAFLFFFKSLKEKMLPSKGERKSV